MTDNKMRTFGCLLIILVFISCQDIEKTERPNNLIPENKMVEVLTELSILNSAKNYNKRFLEETGFKPDEFLLRKYNIDSLQLVESTNYYARNYTQFERMYERVQRNLETLKGELEIKRLREERIRDSILELQRDGDTIVIDSTLLRSRTRDSLIRNIPPREMEQF